MSMQKLPAVGTGSRYPSDRGRRNEGSGERSRRSRYSLGMDIERFRVRPGATIRLRDHDPHGDDKLEKAEGKTRLAELIADLDRLQELLYVDKRHSCLIMFQAIDAGGKDGTIRAVFEGVNPQGVNVVPFQAPTEEELAHDFLWRVHRHVPRLGQLTIFNRSHYEDVLVVRVHDLVPKERWQKRYRHIRDFEQMLVDEGTTIVKFFLHISKEEQRQRQQERIDNPAKQWKFNRGDLEERRHWDEYEKAFEAMLNETSTDDAPWFLVPANRNWYRNLVVASVLVQTLEGMKLRFPEPEPGISGLVVE